MDSRAMIDILRYLIQGVDMLKESMEIALFQYEELASEDFGKSLKGSDLVERS